MRQTYSIQQLFGDSWEPICSSPDLQGIIENLIDMNNEGYFLEEPGKWRLMQWTEGQGTKVVYEKDERDD